MGKGWATEIVPIEKTKSMGTLLMSNGGKAPSANAKNRGIRELAILSATCRGTLLGDHIPTRATSY